MVEISYGSIEKGSSSCKLAKMTFGKAVFGTWELGVFFSPEHCRVTLKVICVGVFFFYHNSHICLNSLLFNHILVFR